MAVPPERFDAVAEQVNAHPEVAHNYERASAQYVVRDWRKPRAAIAEVIAEIEAETGLACTPCRRDEFVVGSGSRYELRRTQDRAATQAGLPLVAEPYRAIAREGRPDGGAR